MFCRITGKSRGLPKPNYFPLLPPISPADAKRFCRITGKSYGLPSHHYIPVILTTRSQRNKSKSVVDDATYGRRKHCILTDYRYMFPIFDEKCEIQKGLLDILNSKSVSDNCQQFVYKITENKCSLVIPAKLEAAVRDGDVQDLMFSKNCCSVLLTMQKGKNVSVDLKDYDNSATENLYEGEGPRPEVLLARSKSNSLMKRKRKITNSQLENGIATTLEAKRANNPPINPYLVLDPVAVKSNIVRPVTDNADIMKPIIESWDWTAYENEVTKSHITIINEKLPKPCKTKSQAFKTELLQISEHILENTISFDPIACVGPLVGTVKPSIEFLKQLSSFSNEELIPLLNAFSALQSEAESAKLPRIKDIERVVQNLKSSNCKENAVVNGVPGVFVTLSETAAAEEVEKKVFLAGKWLKIENDEMFIPGRAIAEDDCCNENLSFQSGFTVYNENENCLCFLPGVVVPSTDTFVAGQMVDGKFMCGQTKVTNGVTHFIQGQTILTPEGYKFIAGVEIDGTFVPGQILNTPAGPQFIPGQTVKFNEKIKFIPGQNVQSDDGDWNFVAGQSKDGEFIAGKTISTNEGCKYVPGLYVDQHFVPGVTKFNDKEELYFEPGLNVQTKQGPRFISGQIVNTDGSMRIFMPGTTFKNPQKPGYNNFRVAETVNDVVFNEAVTECNIINEETCEVQQNSSLSVYGFMVQTNNGIEFYPEKMGMQYVAPGKRVPGNLIRQDAETKFVPGIMKEHGFIPGQIVWTEKGEKFIPGQVIETTEGLKFVPGQVLETKNGPKFVPGQAIETEDGTRFVPGQIFHTKAGPTFIPGQVIYTEEEGERFVPGQVVDTDDGPRFVPGRVVEGNGKVTFLPGQMVQTSEGPKFVTNDVIDSHNGEQVVLLQSFLVSPEELDLLRPNHKWNMASPAGELSIDAQLLRQLSEAGMIIERQMETSVMDRVLNTAKNTKIVQEIINNIGLNTKCEETLLDFLYNIEETVSNLMNDNMTMQKYVENVACNKTMNNNFLTRYTDGENFVQQFVGEILEIVKMAERKQHQSHLPFSNTFNEIAKSFEDIVRNSNISKVETLLLSQTLCKATLKHIQDEIVIQQIDEKKRKAFENLTNKTFNDEIELQKNLSVLIADDDLMKAIEILSKNEPAVLYKISMEIKENSSVESSLKDNSLPTDRLCQIVRNCIINTVLNTSEMELKSMLEAQNYYEFGIVLEYALSLAKALDMHDMSSMISKAVDSKCFHDISNVELIEFVKRVHVMRKLSQCGDQELLAAQQKLLDDPFGARDLANVRKLIRQSGLLSIRPEDESTLSDSKAVPISLLCKNNQLAIEDFLIRKQAPSYGAFVIVKQGLQAVVPREASRDVLTGKIAYTVLDENGIRRFQPLHVFSALKLNIPPKTHQFSIYSCDFAKDENSTVTSDILGARIQGFLTHSQSLTNGRMYHNWNTQSW